MCDFISNQTESCSNTYCILKSCLCGCDKEKVQRLEKATWCIDVATKLTRIECVRYRNTWREKKRGNDPTEHQQIFCKAVKLAKRLFISRTFWCSRVHTLVSTLNTVETRILTGSGMWRNTSVLTVPGCTQQTNTSTRSNLKNLKIKSHQRKY